MTDEQAHVAAIEPVVRLSAQHRENPLNSANG